MTGWLALAGLAAIVIGFLELGSWVTGEPLMVTELVRWLRRKK